MFPFAMKVTIRATIFTCPCSFSSWRWQSYNYHLPMFPFSMKVTELQLSLAHVPFRHEGDRATIITCPCSLPPWRWQSYNYHLPMFPSAMKVTELQLSLAHVPFPHEGDSLSYNYHLPMFPFPMNVTVWATITTSPCSLSLWRWQFKIRNEFLSHPVVCQTF